MILQEVFNVYYSFMSDSLLTLLLNPLLFMYELVDYCEQLFTLAC